jgi:hypothetical protein
VTPEVPGIDGEFEIEARENASTCVCPHPLASTVKKARTGGEIVFWPGLFDGVAGLLQKRNVFGGQSGICGRK